MNKLFYRTRNKYLLFVSFILSILFFNACSTESDMLAPVVNKQNGLTCSAYDSKTNTCTYSLKTYDETSIKSVRIFKNDSLLFESTVKKRSELSGSKYITTSCKYTANNYKIIAEVEDFGGNITRDTLASHYISSISSPKAGESWIPNTTQTITWTSSFSGYVNIQLYKDTVYCCTLASNLLNTGRYSWAIPKTLVAGSNYQIRVSSAFITAARSFSNKFTIAPYINISYPTTITNKFAGDTLGIRWADNLSEYKRIELYKSGKLYSTITNSAKPTVYSYTIPSTCQTGTDYTIRISSTTNSNVYAETPAFKITAPYITLTSPTSSSSWISGLSQPINWTTNLTGNVKIELYKTGKLYQIISSNTSGSYNWTIPTTLSAGSDYSIRVTSNIYTSVYDESSLTISTPVVSYQNQTIYINGISYYKLTSVAGGTFSMGSTNSLDAAASPIHSVTLNGYYLGQTEIPQALWIAVMGTNPSYFKGDNLPVETVTWNDCQTFITKLNQLTGQNFRLPTESEWEYAARGGNLSLGYSYSGSNTIDNVAWYSVNSAIGTKIPGSKSGNELGIFDMSGNVAEWCQDWYATYSSTAQTNPTGASRGTYRIYRGGSWTRTYQESRVAYRNYYPTTTAANYIGLRLSLSW